MIGEKTPEQRLPSLDAIQIAGALQGILSDITEGNRNFDVDLLQEEAVNALGGAIIGGETAGYVDAYTGFGKTMLISLLAEAAVKAGKRVLILAPTHEIADQIIGADCNSGIGQFTDLLENDEKLVKQHYAGRRANAKHPVAVGTYSGMLHEARAAQSGNGRLGEFDLILADECHQSLGTETSRALYSYMPNAIKIGFSATPDYAEDRQSQEIFDRPWFEFSLRNAIDAGRTAPVRALLYETDTTLRLSDSQRDFTDRELAPLIGNPQRNGDALRFAQDFVAEGRQGIIACVPGNNNAHAVLMAGLLSKMDANGREIVAMDIGSHLDKDERIRRLKAYRNGEIDVLTFTRALEEGWDGPASFCINMQPSTSERRIKQLLGRILRKNASGAESIFIDFVDDKEGVNKAQYTASHALELEDVDMDRVLGEVYPKGDAHPIRNLIHSLRSDLLGRLARVQGKLLADVLAAKSGKAVDPLVLKWERTLAKDGMPSELPNNMVLPVALSRSYDRAIANLREELGDEPTIDEIIARLKPTSPQETVLREYGRRVLWLDDADEAPEDMREHSDWVTGLEQLPELRVPLDDVIARMALQGVMEKTLDSLSEREAGILSLRHGFVNNEPRTLDEVGRVYGITRERVRGIEKDTLKKLRHPNRSKALAAFAVESTDVEDEPVDVRQEQDAPAEEPVFKDLPSMPLTDPNDDRPYAVRLQEASDRATRAWLSRQRTHLKEFTETQLNESDFLNHVARTAGIPVGVMSRGTLYERIPEGLSEADVKMVYDKNELRAEALYRQQQLFMQQRERLLTVRRRVAARPSQTHGGASLLVLDARIRAIEIHGHEMQELIARYLGLAEAEPEHMSLRR